jgi:HTH-type transcriptional regulator, transcriptional repressor of NAD biosynthesis genes
MKSNPAKVCFYGPESTGKSTLAKQLAEAYQTEFVPEVAREIITSNRFTVDDILRIGKEQTRRVLEKMKTANRILFCDSDLITTQIYCQHYLGVVPKELEVLEKMVHYEQYFLFDIDVPWIDDGLRDLGNRREEMMNIFRSALEDRGISYVPVRGNYHQREQTIRRTIDALLKD